MTVQEFEDALRKEQQARAVTEQQARDAGRRAEQAVQQLSALQHDLAHAEERLRLEQQRRCAELSPAFSPSLPTFDGSDMPLSRLVGCIAACIPCRMHSRMRAEVARHLQGRGRAQGAGGRQRGHGISKAALGRRRESCSSAHAAGHR